MRRQVQKVSDLLSSYFEEEPTKGFLVESGLHGARTMPAGMPVKPYTFSWETHQSPERFSKTYTFEDRNRLIDFVRELLVFEDQFRHHGEHKISSNEVTVEVYTHDINRITDMDQEYTKHVDQIHKDVLDFGY